MSVQANEQEKLQRFQDAAPEVTIFLRPIAPPMALGLAALSGANFIFGTWMAVWWGNQDSSVYVFPFLFFFGGIFQLIACIEGFRARDTFATILFALWGSLYLSLGLLYFVTAFGVISNLDLHAHYPEVASWGTVIMALTWVLFVASFARDVTLSVTMFFLSFASTLFIAGWWRDRQNDRFIIKTAGYFLIFSSGSGFWHTICCLMEEAFGNSYATFYPRGHLPIARAHDLAQPGLGEPGVRRGQAGLI